MRWGERDLGARARCPACRRAGGPRSPPRLPPAGAAASSVPRRPGCRHPAHRLLTAARPPRPAVTPGLPGSGGYDDADLAVSSEEDEAERERLIALVELARGGDKEAFGLLYDHYHPSVYRFLYYRIRSQTLAEDLTSETFFRALRA